MIDRSKDRVKQTGEVFTPLPLVDEILSKLPTEVWKDHTKTFLDNSCGDGNFLVRVVAWKIHNGSTPKQTLETTYGVDIMEDNVSHARERVLINAFAASRIREELLPHLTHEDERRISTTKEFATFAGEYNEIVCKNIVCHDALTYDYSFSGQPPKTSEVQTLDTLQQFGIEF